MFKAKAALITGSTSGIGLGMAETLAKKGCNIMLNGFGDAIEITRLQKRIAAENGVQVLYHGADVAEPKEIEAMVNCALERFKNIDILINNAGYKYVAPIEDYPPEHHDRAIAVNLNAAFHTIRLLLPAMKQSGWGRIINTISVVGVVGSVNRASYVAAKHGLAGLTKAVALEVADKGITCNGICPGWVDTAFNTREGAEMEAYAKGKGITIQEAEKVFLEAKQPSKALVSVQQLAELTAFLCSENAEQITGALIAVDGGWSAQ